MVLAGNKAKDLSLVNHITKTIHHHHHHHPVIRSVLTVHINSRFLKGSIPDILFDPFLNTLFHLYISM